jgi:flagellar protein FlaG
MAAETFTTAMFLITAVIAAAVLINAIFPIVYNMAETFSSSSHAADVRLRTDITIVNTFASGNTAKVCTNSAIRCLLRAFK